MKYLEKTVSKSTEDVDGYGVCVIPTENFASRSLAAANLIATTARPGEHWHIIDGDMDELERFKDSDLGEAYESLTQGVEVSLRHASYAYASPRATHRAHLDREIQSLTADSAKNLGAQLSRWFRPGSKPMTTSRRSVYCITALYVQYVRLI